MSGAQVDEHVRRLTAVLSGVDFPAMKWELYIHAESIGADIRSRVELYRLPAGLYRDPDSVISTIGHQAQQRRDPERP